MLRCVRDEPTPVTSRRYRQRRSRSRVPIGLGLLALLLISSGAAYWVYTGRTSLVPASDSGDVAAPESSLPLESDAERAQEDLPPVAVSPPAEEAATGEAARARLGEGRELSDESFRDTVGEVADHPLAVQVLRRPDLVRALTAAVLEVTEGRSPKKRFGYLEPRAAFDVRGDLLYLRALPESYARYDPLVNAFLAIKAADLVEVYALFEPLFDDAYAELGYPGEDFDPVIVRAIDLLLEVPVLTKEPALVPRAKTYAFEDPALEELLGSQRQLLRMGPRNVERVQQHLLELRAALLARS